MNRHNIRHTNKYDLANGQSSDSITANWSYWKQVPALKVFEAVYLTLSINPMVADIRAESYPYLEVRGSETAQKMSKILNDRLNITKAHIKVESFALIAFFPGEDGLHSDVSLSEFGQWAKGMGWPLPEEFPTLKIDTDSKAGERRGSWEGFDPDDDKYPEELDVAVMAWNAVAKQGQGGDGTPKKRLENWISAIYPEWKSEKVRRIATICNWDKSPGRK